MTSSGAVVVSGASSGIGAATVAALANAGYLVYAGVRAEGDGRRIAAEHGNVRVLSLDVSDAGSIERAMAVVAASSVPLRAVVCNAGIVRYGPLEHMPIDQLRDVFEVNVLGALALAQAALPLLREDAGRIVFVGSISGRLSIPYIAPYSASKFALRAIADALRVELAPARIAVSLIEPGSVNTPIWEKGRSAKDGVLGAIGASPRPHYRTAVGQIVANSEWEERNGMPVERVARVIADAVRARKPRRQYLVGALAGSVLALLPGSWRDRALRVSMRLP